MTMTRLGACGTLMANATMYDPILEGAKQRALELLADLDRRIERAAGPPRTLDPARTYATPIRELGARLIAVRDDPHLVSAFAQTLETIVDAQLHNFPENVFWDFDLLAARLLADGERWPQGAVDYLRKMGLLMARLEHMFGCHSTIRFQYVHDFIYGFDWARWAVIDPGHRSRVGPYDMRFVRYVLQRGEQLVRGVAVEPPSQDAAGEFQWRNMFSFRRDPEAEAILLRDLAEHDLVPVRAWDTDAAPPDLSFAFTDLRRERAEALGLMLPV